MKRNNSRLAKVCRRKIDEARRIAKQSRNRPELMTDHAFYLGKADAYQDVLSFIGETLKEAK